MYRKYASIRRSSKNLVLVRSGSESSFECKLNLVPRAQHETFPFPLIELQ